jgi:hypothetical protein
MNREQLLWREHGLLLWKIERSKGLNWEELNGATGLMQLRAGWQLVTEDHFLYWYHLSIWLERKSRYITKDLRASLHWKYPVGWPGNSEQWSSYWVCLLSVVVDKKDICELWINQTKLSALGVPLDWKTWELSEVYNKGSSGPVLLQKISPLNQLKLIHRDICVLQLQVD